MRRSRGKDFGALLPRQTEAPKLPSFSGERRRRENRVQSRLGIWGSDMSSPNGLRGGSLARNVFWRIPVLKAT